ncbi:hypothetical protein Taro_031067 [Colocasia esculenta]|uniref:Uncharacterized protein n=1 Tax=Colocasia esculenta TaxID=4460 RepID=A0A843VTM7_COLES|nr:hypothetical protein [Colocasia esculenta]
MHGNSTPKHLGCLNTLHPNPRDEFATCWGRVEELLVAGELWIDHKKAIFFPFSSATTCKNRPLEVDQRTPKHLGCLNTLHTNPRDEFSTFWGRVEELLVAGELWIDHKKAIFFPFSSAATCTNRPLEVDQRRRPCERDGPIGRVLRSCRNRKPVAL